MFEGLKSATDVVLLASAAKGVAKERQYTKEAYDRAALDIACRVENGSLDPLAGEATLANAEHDLDSPRSTTSSSVERASKPLERLVEKGLIDPIVAEDIMDINFSRHAVSAAIDQIRRK